MKKILVIATLMVSILFGGVSTPTMQAYAENMVGLKSVLSVSPMNSKIILAPGEKYTGVIKITNPVSSNKDITYSTSITPYSEGNAKDGLDSYDVSYDTTTAYNKIMNWITIDEETGRLGTGETKQLAYSINVPLDAPAGGQYATIMIEDTTPQSETSENGIMIQDSVRIAHIIYAEITGVTRKEGTILENYMPAFLLNNKLEATSAVRNNGNVHTNAEYILQVWPIFSEEEICTNEESSAKSLIMPESEKYHTETCELPIAGVFRAKQIVKIFGEESIIEKTIIVCPIWLLFLIIFAVVALIIYIVLRAKNKGKKSRKSDN